MLLLLQFSSDLIQTFVGIAYHGGLQAVTFLDDRANFKILCNFEILKWEFMEKS